jgi:UPF0716 protein FxsA
MAAILFVLLIVVPIAELYVIIKVGSLIGVLPTIGLLIGISILGAWLLKQQGMATWRKLQESLNRGEMPTQHVTDGALILLGGALLMTPGFLSDIVGLLFLFPPTRAAVKGATRRLLANWAARRSGRYGEAATIYREARVVRSRRDEPTSSSSPQLPEEGPSAQGRRPGEGGSPGMG